MRDLTADLTPCPSTMFLVTEWRDCWPEGVTHEVSHDDHRPFDPAAYIDPDTTRLRVLSVTVCGPIVAGRDVTVEMLGDAAERAFWDADDEGVKAPEWAARICGYDAERTVRVSPADRPWNAADAAYEARGAA